MFLLIREAVSFCFYFCDLGVFEAQEICQGHSLCCIALSSGVLASRNVSVSANDESLAKQVETSRLFSGLKADRMMNLGLD